MPEVPLGRGDGGRGGRGDPRARDRSRPRGRVSRAAASSLRSWRSAIPTSCGAWCSRAPGPRWTPTFARGRASSTGCWRSLRTSARSSRTSSCGSTRARLPGITASTLVVAGDRDMTSRPELRRAVADRTPGARFEVMRRGLTSRSRRVESPRGCLLARGRLKADDGAVTRARRLCRREAGRRRPFGRGGACSRPHRAGGSRDRCAPGGRRRDRRGGPR